uniref:Uncharacterized protein n=1 Tax=viral metagenome TaxID=1070528 RepID=A0A6C0BPT5_9ZZZZ
MQHYVDSIDKLPPLSNALAPGSNDYVLVRWRNLQGLTTQVTLFLPDTTRWSYVVIPPDAKLEECSLTRETR